MEELTQNQLDFLLTFFESNQWAGWKTVATCLLKEGRCIVAGNKPMWKGGIGNFITIERAPDLYDCLLYKFDLNNFLDSEWFKSYQEEQLVIIKEKKDAIETQYSQIILL